MKDLILALAIAISAVLEQEPAGAAELETVANLTGPMPTGLTVAPNGRIFINYPQWGDAPGFAVAELRDGVPVPYPDTALNAPRGADPETHLLSVQSVVADARNRLWILDTGAPGFAAPVAGGAKLVAIDLATDAVVRTIVLEPDVVLPTTYLNDIRFDLRQGDAGVAYITDSSIGGPGGLIVVDLATGNAMRRLSGHGSTMPDPEFTPVIGGEVLMNRPATGAPMPWLVASDGIAISPDGETLYYCALSSRRLFAVPTALLRDPEVSEAELAAAVQDLGPKAPSDGMVSDAQGRLYAGDYEAGTIRRRADGEWQVLAEDSRILWPDTLSIGTDGYLYFTANQLDRQHGFHQGTDLRRPPYQVLRVRIDAGPVLLD